MVGFAYDAESVLRARIAESNRGYQACTRQALTHALANEMFLAYLQYREAYDFAAALYDEKKQFDAKIASYACYKNLNATERLVVSCFDLTTTKAPEIEASIKNNLTVALEDFYQVGTISPTMALNEWTKNRLAWALPTLKALLLNAISTEHDPQKKQEALWFALIPGTPLREMLAIADWSTTSMGRGTFKKVIYALIHSPLTGQPNPYLSPNVITALTNMPENTRLSFMTKLRKHAPALYNAVPIDLKVRASIPTARLGEVTSRDRTNASSTGTALLPANLARRRDRIDDLQL